jgi:hypothetical protein
MLTFRLNSYNLCGGKKRVQRKPDILRKTNKRKRFRKTHIVRGKK